MKKLIALIISSVIVAAIAIGIIVVVVSHQNDQEHTLTVSTTYGGTLEISIDNKNYSIESDEAQTFTVKRKSNIYVKAVAENSHSFIAYLLNGVEYSQNSEISLVVDKESELHAKFGHKSVNATISEGSISEKVSIDLSKNLLAQLNTKFQAPNGYSYVYKIGGNVVTENTQISTDTTITRTKVTIPYTITFKHDGVQVGDTITYTVETESIIAPAVPSAPHYTVSWEDYSLQDLGDMVVNSIKTPIEYPITFNLPSGYTFEDGSTSIETTYNIENYENYQTPSLKDVYVGEYKELAWNDITFTFANEPISVSASEIESPFTISFKFGDTVVATRTYTISNQTVETPAVPTSTEYPTLTHYENLKWASYTVPTTNLTDFDVQLEKTAKTYTINFKYATSESKVNYTYEDYINPEFKVTVPAVPTVAEFAELKHYTDLKWKEVVFPENLGNFEVGLDKTAIQYTLNIEVPEGYTVDFETTYTFTVEDFDNSKYFTNRPELPEGKLGYYLEWENKEITSDNVQAINTIAIQQKAVTYTATFKNGDTVVGSTTYTIENYKTAFAAPEVPVDAEEKYVYGWESYTIDKNNLGTVNADNKAIGSKVINVKKLAFVMIEYYFEDSNFKLNGASIAKVYVEINAEGKVVTSNGAPVIYEAKQTDGDQVVVKGNLVDVINKAVALKDGVEVSDSVTEPQVVALELYHPDDEYCEDPISYTAINDNLETTLNGLLTQCTTTGYLVRAIYE